MPDSLLERFERSFVPLMDDAYTLARHLVRDEHDAQDVVQEAYLRAWRFFAGFRGGNERAWLLSIVRNCCYTWRQKRRPGERSVEYDDAQHSGDDRSELAADARMLAESDRQELRLALEQLPIEMREVIVLREIEELSYQEIARVTGVPMGTVMSRLARARQRLQRALKLSA